MRFPPLIIPLLQVAALVLAVPGAMVAAVALQSLPARGLAAATPGEVTMLAALALLAASLIAPALLLWAAAAVIRQLHAIRAAIETPPGAAPPAKSWWHQFAP